MKRTSKRSSRRFITRRSSRPLTPNRHRNVEDRMIGKEIDPDRVTGARGRQLDAAMDRYEIFQQKAPRKVMLVQHDVPKLVVPIGDCVAVMYRSNKWHEDGTEDVDYKHRHEKRDGKMYEPGKGVRLYENAKFVSSELKRNAGTVKVPQSLVALPRLAYCLGLFVRRDDDGEIHEVNPRNTWLCASPDGHMLALLSDKPQPNGDVGYLCLMWGGNLRTLKEGIDG